MRKAYVFHQRPNKIDRLAHALENNVIILGWSDAENLNGSNITYENVRDTIKSSYFSEKSDYKSSGKAATHLWRFNQEMEIDDLVLVPASHGFHVAEVTGKSVYDLRYVDEDMAYRRSVKWLTKGQPIPYSDVSKNLMSSLSLGRATSKDVSKNIDQITTLLLSRMKGTLWTTAELRCVVRSYFTMLGLERKKISYVKKAERVKLMGFIPRGEKAIEFKYQNVSSVLSQLGLDYINGYKPKDHIQLILVDIVEEYLDQSFLENVATNNHEDRYSQIISGINVKKHSLGDYFVDPPERSQSSTKVTKKIRFLANKVDHFSQQRMKKALGDAGEEFVFLLEQAQLQTLPSLLENVKWVARDDGDGCGYDILSFELNGSEKFIEVKTTNGGSRTPFYLSRYEYEFACRNPEAFVIYRVYDFSKNPTIYQAKFPFTNNLSLQAESYRITPN